MLEEGWRRNQTEIDKEIVKVKIVIVIIENMKIEKINDCYYNYFICQQKEEEDKKRRT